MSPPDAVLFSSVQSKFSPELWSGSDLGQVWQAFLSFIRLVDCHKFPSWQQSKVARNSILPRPPPPPASSHPLLCSAALKGSARPGNKKLPADSRLQFLKANYTHAPRPGPGSMRIRAWSSAGARGRRRRHRADRYRTLRRAEHSILYNTDQG